VRLALIHGFTQTGRSWAPIVERLRVDGDVVCPDLPGHGTNRRAATVADTADQLAAAVGPATWVGYSMGGRVCLSLALDHPEVVERLVLVSTTAGIRDPTERAARCREDEARADHIEAVGVPAFVEEWLAGPLWRTLARADAGIEHRLTNTAGGLADSLRLAGTGAMPDCWNRLPEIGVETAVVTGDEDAKFTAIGDELAAGIGAPATRVRVPGAGHAVPWEQPDMFARLLTDQARAPG
jgi:2-succinyl-6-hydroxy-2,4-cyclohexadiene-1-carboxylate synthase